MAALSCQRTLLVSILLTLLPVTAHGQRRTLFESDSLPRDLVLALLAPDGGSGSLPEVMVGYVPARFASRLVIPAGSRILGTMLNFAGATVALDVSIHIDSLRRLLNATIESRGWKPASPQFPTGGFQHARMRYPDVFCAGDTLLGFDLFPLGTGGTLLKYRISPGGNFQCSPPPEGRLASMAAMRSHPMPELQLPDESDRLAAECMGGQQYNSRGSTGTRVGSDRTPEAMLEFFGKQLADSGWATVPTESGARVVSRQWVKRDSTQVPRNFSRLTLTVAVPTDHPRCREIQMEQETGFEP